MALRPQRTFRRRQVESSDSDCDSDGPEERPAEEPGEPGRPSAGGRAEGVGPLRRARGARGRGLVWASSRRSPGTASRGAGVLLESKTVNLSADEGEGAHPSSESEGDSADEGEGAHPSSESEGDSVDEGEGAHPSSESEGDSADEGEGAHPSSESEGDQSPSSHRSSSLEEKEVSPTVKIPDASFIREARRKRELARTPGDYISLDVNHPSTTSDRKKSSEYDPESDPDDDEKRILFTPKPQTLRQRMAEETWLSGLMANVLAKPSILPSPSLWERGWLVLSMLALDPLAAFEFPLRDSTAASYLALRIIISIEELESSTRSLLLKRSEALLKRRQDELKWESSYLQQLSRDILQDCKKVFEDVHDDFCNVQNILLKFQQWREKFPDSYYEAFVGFCLPKLLSPLIRVQLLDWNPLKLDSIGLNQMPWFTSITEFMDGSMNDAKKEDESDKKILSAVINKTVVPHLTDFVEFIWDPLSASQTRSLTVHCRLVFEHSASENELSKSKQLFRNILLWNGLLPDDTLQDLGLGKLLNRYLIIALTHAFPGPDAVKKCSQIAACLPEKWFENSAMRTSIPQLENFIQFLLRSARKLSTSEFR
ncbi:GC-rich sequence DNA-binding factor 2 [Microtus ochrogaster]|uniref:GC-rich sequence DNA-binding factor 2 n=1 Tax=Microtus ochrogaster TaxID=79684 RepID=A0A8J6GRC6_MICOH|nr:GC-rich sequence DNA-binding factor 2 [Microtus ochrogaster]